MYKTIIHSRHVWTYLTAFSTVIPNTVMKFNYVDIFANVAKCYVSSTDSIKVFKEFIHSFFVQRRTKNPVAESSQIYSVIIMQ